MTVTTRASGGEFRAHRYAVLPVPVPNSNRSRARVLSTARIHASKSLVPASSPCGPCAMNATSVAVPCPKRPGRNASTNDSAGTLGTGQTPLRLRRRRASRSPSSRRTRIAQTMSHARLTSTKVSVGVTGRVAGPSVPLGSTSRRQPPPQGQLVCKDKEPQKESLKSAHLTRIEVEVGVAYAARVRSGRGSVGLVLAVRALLRTPEPPAVGKTPCPWRNGRVRDNARSS